ncbi:hypothetical protein [Sphingomonas sp.]|uniref:hypothetical protein n=1 Tax=Sphingomonas sp. TaxID=28214 RepID=UPI0038A102CB
MFGLGKARREATEIGAAAARMAIMPFWVIWDRAFDDRIWSDPYVLGVIGGSISAQMLPMTGRKLNPTDKGFVMLDAMRSLGAPQHGLDRGLELAERGDPDWARGYDHGIVTFLIMAGALKPEAYEEPDIVAAKKDVPSMRQMDIAINGAGERDDNQDLAVAYISRLVQKHKKAHYPSLQ